MNLIARLYIGTQYDSTGKALNPYTVRKVKSNLVKALTGIFGGVTALEGVGSYTHNDGTVANEKSLVLEVICPDAPSARSYLTTLCEGAAADLNQESVGLVFIPGAHVSFVTARKVA